MGTRLTLVGLAVLVCGIVIAGTMFLVQSNPEANENVRFVHKFMTSVYDDTPFYKNYIRKSDLAHVRASRSLLSRGYRIEVVESDLPNFLEYHLIFSNRNRGILYLSMRGSDVKEAVLDVFPSK